MIVIALGCLVCCAYKQLGPGQRHLSMQEACVCVPHTHWQCAGQQAGAGLVWKGCLCVMCLMESSGCAFALTEESLAPGPGWHLNASASDCCHGSQPIHQNYMSGLAALKAVCEHMQRSATRFMQGGVAHLSNFTWASALDEELWDAFLCATH